MHTCALYRHRGRTLASLVFVRTHRLAQSENPDIVSARRARPGPSPHIPTLGALSPPRRARLRPGPQIRGCWQVCHFPGTFFLGRKDSLSKQVNLFRRATLHPRTPTLWGYNLVRKVTMGYNPV
jgi:hypothetical protein